jgi:hypothetical protein
MQAASIRQKVFKKGSGFVASLMLCNIAVRHTRLAHRAAYVTIFNQLE